MEKQIVQDIPIETVTDPKTLQNSQATIQTTTLEQTGNLNEENQQTQNSTPTATVSDITPDSQQVIVHQRKTRAS